MFPGLKFSDFAVPFTGKADLDSASRLTFKPVGSNEARGYIPAGSPI